jgi:hypothetical protein
MVLEKENFDYLKEKILKLNFVNAFGNEVKVKNTTINYEVKENIEKKQNNEKTKKSSYDLDDEEENKKEKDDKPKIKTKKVSLESNIDLELSDLINSSGYYNIKLEMDNNQFDLKEKVNKVIKAFNKVTIEYLEIYLEDRISNSKKEDEIKINYPSRTGRNFKATQDDIIRIKLKLNFEDEKPMKLEQLFLRLKHNDIKKTFDSYSNYYNEKNKLYYISFELDDPVKIESYNGKYTLSIYLSDKSIEKPIIWNFADMEIKYIKPQDLSEAEPNYSNFQKPIMEPTFNPENTLEKNKFLGVVFTAIIIFCFFVLFGLLNYNDYINFGNFPKEKMGGIFNMLFIILVLVIAYILVLFWMKLNILQTFGIFVVMFIPGVSIVYQAMKNLNIEI